MENIALALSGGGFRAASFSLGTLSYLNKILYKGKPLLQNVRFISSTSGGSITNLVYSSFIFKGKNFEDCFAYLNEQLTGEQLLARALQVLKKSAEWKKRAEKSRNLINAFSIVYDELLNKEILGMFSEPTGIPHLEEICVNSTEFTNGLPFRFQSQHAEPVFPKGKIGNRFIYFTLNGKRAAAKIKLADILACSSCFPSGFEPMIFPDDFAYDALSVAELRQGISYTANSFTIKEKMPENLSEEDDAEEDEGTFIDPITGEAVYYNNLDLLPNEAYNKDLRFGIMDGGVSDNQAIDAFKRANERRESNSMPPFDLLITCDVTSHYMDGYTLPMEKSGPLKWVTPKAFIAMWIVCMLVLPGLFFLPKPWTGWMYIVATLSSILYLPLLYIFVKKTTTVFSKKPAGTFTNMFRKYSGAFLSLRWGVLKQMIASRFKSVFILANDIYLKQIRRMYYDDLFNDERYKDKIVQNVIYDLSRVKFDPNDISTDELHPSTKMIAVAEKARTMGTTLWFDKVHQQNNVKESIIATGRFTTCYSLLQHLTKLPTEKMSPELEALKVALAADWERFNEDPYWNG